MYILKINIINLRIENNSLFILGITGGIGSGKSFVSSLLLNKGIPVYIADFRAKEIMSSNKKVREEIINSLGKECYKKDGSLNIFHLRELLFQSLEKRIELNDIVHPRVYEDFCKWVKSEIDSTEELVAVESALLLQGNFSYYCHWILAILTPIELRIERVIKRDGLSREDVEKRIIAQIPDSEFKKKANRVLINDKTREYFRIQVEQRIDEIRKIINAK